MAFVATPFRNAVAVTPSDSTIYFPGLKGFYVGGAGAVAIMTPGNQTVTLTAIIVGTVYPISANRIMATGTTATLIIGLW